MSKPVICCPCCNKKTKVHYDEPDEYNINIQSNYKDKYLKNRMYEAKLSSIILFCLQILYFLYSSKVNEDLNLANMKIILGYYFVINIILLICLIIQFRKDKEHYVYYFLVILMTSRVIAEYVFAFQIEEDVLADVKSKIEEY
jgi:hypothetical protein